MTFKKIALGLAAATMVTAPVVAQSNLMPSIAPLSGDESELAGGSIIIAIAATAAVIGGIIIASDGDEREVPVSG